MKILIAEQKSARISDLGINNAFDLSLYQMLDGHYVLEVFMKIQFFFKDNHPHIWFENEEEQFIDNWQKIIHEFWGDKIIHSLPSGEDVTLKFDFQPQKGGWMYDHWEITVIKIGPKDFKVSYVEPDRNNVQLDSQDLTYSGRQRAAIHEFGHMIGLADEYKNSRHITDPRSVMHSGEEPRDRHFEHFSEWVTHKLKEVSTVSA